MTASRRLKSKGKSIHRSQAPPPHNPPPKSKVDHCLKFLKPKIETVKTWRPPLVSFVLHVERGAVKWTFLPSSFSSHCNCGESGDAHLGWLTVGACCISSTRGWRPFAFLSIARSPWPSGPLPVAFSLQSQQQSPSNTLSSLSTSTACVTPQTSLKQLKKSERSATTTRAWGSPATPTATPSSSGSSTSASATGSSYPSAWCWPARSSCVLSSSWTPGRPGSLWVYSKGLCGSQIPFSIALSAAGKFCLCLGLWRRV